MSLEQVSIFYEVLAESPVLYEQYFNQCGSQGFFGSWHWHKTKIVRFAASLGYTFTENELEQTWFENAPCQMEASVNSLEYEPASTVMGHRSWVMGHGSSVMGRVSG